MLIDILRAVLYIAFTFSALLLILVILLQEGKGGGLGAAFGGAGGEAFGVGAGGINRFTATLAVIFIGSAVILAATASDSAAGASDQPVKQAPAGPGDGGGAPAGKTTGAERPAKPAAPAKPAKPDKPK